MPRIPRPRKPKSGTGKIKMIKRPAGFTGTLPAVKVSQGAVRKVAKIKWRAPVEKKMREVHDDFTP